MCNERCGSLSTLFSQTESIVAILYRNDFIRASASVSSNKDSASKGSSPIFTNSFATDVSRKTSYFIVRCLSVRSHATTTELSSCANVTTPICSAYGRNTATSTVAVSEHSFTSVTVTEYVPSSFIEIVGVVSEVLHSYCKSVPSASRTVDVPKQIS